MNKTKKVHIGPSNRMFLKHHETTQQSVKDSFSRYIGRLHREPREEQRIGKGSTRQVDPTITNSPKEEKENKRAQEGSDLQFTGRTKILS